MSGMCFRNLYLAVQSVVPSLEGSEPMIALLLFRNQAVESWIQLNPLYCRGAGQRAPMLLKSAERTMTLLCPWEKATSGHYEIFLEDREGKAEVSDL